MARISMMLRLLLVLVGIVTGDAFAQAQSSPKPAVDQEEKGGEEKEEEEKPRRNHFKELTKIRQGSFIRSDPEPSRPTVRGRFERQRDREVVVHYQRMAQLDVISELAADTGQGQLGDKVEAVRRREQERFRRAMARLREAVHRELMTKEMQK